MKKPSIEWCIIIAGIFFLLPFFILCFYNHPATDDFGCTNIAKQYGFWGSQKFYYTDWKCAFLHTIIMSINPLTIQWFWGFKIIPFILLFAYLFLLYALVNTISGHSITTHQKWAIVSAFGISYFYYVPNVAHIFYWMTGYASYQISTMLLVVFLILLMKFLKEKGHKNKITFFLVFLTILIMQGSESYMFFMFVLISSLLLIKTFLNRRLDRLFFILFFISVAGVVFVLTSPGIYNRAANENPEMIKSSRHISVALKYVFLEIFH